ncbi:MAG TPA: metalloregulator ArsR/SmtB family transcription factor [Candidatus Saccharimonadales bacterium]|nr:metalloregulator ArsR/SmtB family transcription factor [Candidatus Saccharimonadales bacterium]
MNATTLLAIAEPNRLQIVELLREEPRSVNDIAHRLHFSQPQASKHLKVLSAAGLVRSRAKAQKRIYGLEPQPFADLQAWLSNFDHAHWQQRFDKLEQQLKKGEV